MRRLRRLDLDLDLPGWVHDWLEADRMPASMMERYAAQNQPKLPFELHPHQPKPPPPPPQQQQQQQQQQRRQRRQYTREGDGVVVHDDNNNIYGTTGACFSLPLPFPAISPAQVLAPKILQVHKVATYVRAKLAAEGVEVEMVEPKQHQEEEEEGEEEDVLVVERTTSTSTRSTGKCVCVCVCLYACWGRGLRFLVWTSAWGG